MTSLIQTCRQNFGEAPRKFPLWDRFYLFPKAPDWLPNDALYQSVKDRPLLLKHGRVVLGALVQANGELFAPTRLSLPAQVVWSEAPSWGEDIPTLRSWGYRLFQLKISSPPGELERLAQMLNNERARPQSHALPESFSEGATLFLSSLLVFRRHLPYGYITSGVLPLVVLPEKTKSVMILPGRYWPSELKDR